MGFVKMHAEITRIEAVTSRPRFVGDMLSVDFLSDPAVIGRLLPPPLGPAAAARVTVMVGRWRSNCVGNFCSAAMYLAARHAGLDGRYLLANYVDQDAALIFGREVFGEPKKLGDCGLSRRERSASGWLERHGVRLMGLEAEIPTALAPYEARGVTFNIKARPAAGGTGLQEDAILTHAASHTRVTRAWEGTGAVTVRGTAHDPLDELPILTTERATYVECDLTVACTVAAVVPAQELLPYHHGRNDDWSAFDTVAGDATVWRDPWTGSA